MSFSAGSYLSLTNVGNNLLDLYATQTRSVCFYHYSAYRQDELSDVFAVWLSESWRTEAARVIRFRRYFRNA